MIPGAMKTQQSFSYTNNAQGSDSYNSGSTQMDDYEHNSSSKNTATRTRPSSGKRDDPAAYQQYAHEAQQPGNWV